MNLKMISMTLALAAISTSGAVLADKPNGPGNNKVDECAKELQKKFEAISLIKDMEDAQKRATDQVDFLQNPSRYSESTLQEWKQRLEETKESLDAEHAALREEKEAARKATFGSSGKLKRVEEKLREFYKKRNSYYAERESHRQDARVARRAESGELLAGRVNTIKVELLQGDELAKHYQENPTQKQMDESNGYKRYIIHKYATFDFITEKQIEGIRSGELNAQDAIGMVATGVSYPDFFAITKDDEKGNCTIKRMFTVDP